MQRSYTQADYEDALKREQQAWTRFLHPLLLFGVLAIGMGGFLLASLITNPLFFAAVYGLALFLGWQVGRPYYEYRQTKEYTRRMEAWMFMTNERTPPVTSIPEPPPGYCPNDVYPTVDRDPRSYYQQGYPQQMPPSQMV